MVSYDVESLFTIIPLAETIDFACHYVYHSDISPPPFDEKHFKKLLWFATSGIFSFNGNLYKQTDGVSMGSPLGPTLANLFMCHLENNFVNSFHSKPLLYCRYIDDVMCIFKDIDTCNSFFNFINTQHSSIKFTMQLESNNCLPFLDVNVKVINNKFVTSVHTKQTNTNLLLNYSAFCPNSYKIGLIKCFLHRSFRICSSWFTFIQYVNSLHTMFSLNNYPSNIFWHVVNSFVNSKFNRTPPLTSNNSNNVSVLVLPYFGQCSDLFKLKFNRLVKQFNLNCRLVHTTFKVSNYFSLKDKCIHGLRSNVIYKFTCTVNNSCYIGKTKRHLFTRIFEHCNTPSAIFNHRLSCNCTCNLTNFRVLDQARHSFDLSILESLHIKYCNPNLNTSIVNSGRSYFLKLY